MKSARAILLFFSLCALGDFVWGLIRGRSIVEGVISAALGLLGTAWFVFLFWLSTKDKPKSDPSSGEQRDPAR